MMYRKAYDYCKSTGEGIIDKDIIMEYPYILAKIYSICPYFWHLAEYMKDRPSTNPLYTSNSLDSHEEGIASTFGAIDLDDVTNLSSEDDMEGYYNKCLIYCKHYEELIFKNALFK